MWNFILELKRAARRLGDAWRLALTCVVFLGVSIGSTTTVFSFMNAALFRPLPYPEASRLVAITEDDGSMPQSRLLVSAPTLGVLRRGTTSFESVGAYRDDAALIAVDDNVQMVYVTAIDSSLLETLRVRPMLGAAPTSTDYAGVARVALVSEVFWRAHLAGLPTAIGSAIRLNDTAYQVVGIMPAGFAFSQRADIWIPLNENVKDRATRADEPTWFSLVARLRPGVTQAQARQELALIESRLRQDAPSYWRRMHIMLRPSLPI